jgi:hypothetical protein
MLTTQTALIVWNIPLLETSARASNFNFRQSAGKQMFELLTKRPLANTIPITKILRWLLCVLSADISLHLPATVVNLSLYIVIRPASN